MPRQPKLGTFQAAMYSAEAALGSGRVFRNVTEVRTYLDNLLASDDFQATWPFLYEVTVERRHSSARWSLAICEGNIICLADTDQSTVLHELAHLCSPHDCHGHGEDFARAYLTLVRQEMGFHAYGALLSALGRSDVFRGCDLTTLDTRV